MLRLASFVAIGTIITTGQALATSIPPAELGTTARPDSGRCYGRHCRARVYGYRSGYRTRWHTQDPSRMRTGSRRWWDAKDREGSTGRP